MKYLDYGFIFSQETYVDDLLHRLQLTDLKAASLPSVVGKTLSVFEGTPLDDPFTYRNTIGALQYFTNTRLDIAYMVNHLSQFLQWPTDLHWQVKRILHYLSGTKSFRLLFQRSSDLSISAFSDVDWALNIDD